MSETIEITRYPNRRLYDRSQKKYVRLGDIEALVLSGKDVRVTDNKTDKDLTHLILIQIILESHPERMELFPASFLQAILRADNLALDWLRAYFAQAMSFMDHYPGASANPFAPGMELWRSFMPEASEDAPKSPPDEK